MFISIIIYIFVVSKLKKSIKKSNVMNANEVLDTCGLNWTVREEYLTTESGILIPEKKAIIREDTNNVLGVVGKNYCPYQNSELAELLFLVSQSTGLDIHSGGSFGAGEKVWFQIKSDDLDLGGDTVKGYLSGFNSFDGSKNLAFGNTNITVSCLNTFHAGYREVESKVRHTMNMKPRIEEILQRIGILCKEEENIFKQIKMLASTPIKPNVKQELTDILFAITPEEKIKGLSTRKENMVKEFQTVWNTEIEQKGANQWGAFSAITRFTTHHANRNIERRNELKMFGKSGDIDRTAWRHVSKSLQTA